MNYRLGVIFLVFFLCCGCASMSRVKEAEKKIENYKKAVLERDNKITELQETVLAQEQEIKDLKEELNMFGAFK